ncbi:alpha/beta hydrolase [candidate division KSB1 bacterium]|nr:alpha/beta hydrolase [candidate division KSB1 bacterium]
MKYVWLVLGWFFAIIFSLLTISMLMLNNWLNALVLFLVVLLCLPPFNTFIRNRFKKTIHPTLRIVLLAGLLFVFAKLLVSSGAASIYKSPAIEARLMQIYDEKMKDWPMPYEDIFLNTRYGKVHVIASGPDEAPPMLLLHASGVSSWSWKFNIEALSKFYKTYAIDLIGDAGKSEFASLDNIMKTGKDQADLYAEIADKLGVGKAVVVGASEGGFIGTNLALHHPERVEKLALLGPMGYSGAIQSVMRITFAQLFPLKSVQESTFSWAFSDDAKLKEEYGEWFRLLMSGVFPAKVAPLPISAEARQSIAVPVLFVFGERDNLVGDPVKAKALVQDMPDVRVEIIDAGHLMGGEQPEKVNSLITGFFEGHE